MALARLHESISRMLARPVRLTITDNTHSIIRIRVCKSGYTVRLHHMFLAADEEVLKALKHYIQSRSRRPPSLLRDFVDANSAKIKKAPPRSRRAVLRPVGRFFNLKHIFNELNCEYFDGRVDCGITWGVNRKVRTQKTIRLGSYSEATGTIRVNPVLDRSYVPNYVIRGIVYHEMLHHFLGAARQDGRNSAHSHVFRRLERRYRHHHKLQSWLEKHRQHLLGR